MQPLRCLSYRNELGLELRPRHRLPHSGVAGRRLRNLSASFLLSLSHCDLHSGQNDHPIKGGLPDASFTHLARYAPCAEQSANRSSSASGRTFGTRGAPCTVSRNGTGAGSGEYGTGFGGSQVQSATAKALAGLLARL